MAGVKQSPFARRALKRRRAQQKPKPAPNFQPNTIAPGYINPVVPNNFGHVYGR